jgi:hypothetical protein
MLHCPQNLLYSPLHLTRGSECGRSSAVLTTCTLKFVRHLFSLTHAYLVGHGPEIPLHKAAPSHPKLRETMFPFQIPAMSFVRRNGVNEVSGNRTPGLTDR